MGRDFLLPDLGEGLTEAEIVAWLVAPGDVIAIDQPVVEVESAKSIVELPSPFGGVVQKLFGEPGQVIHAGQVLLTVASAAGTDAPVTDAPVVADPVGAEPVGAEPVGAEPVGAEPVGAGPVGAAREPVLESSGAVLVGYGTGVRTRPARGPVAGRFGGGVTAATPPAASVPPALVAAVPATPVPDFTAPAVTAPAATPPTAAMPTAAMPVANAPVAGAPSATMPALLDPARRSPVVSPIVRRLARENGFDAGQLLGSGTDSLVTRTDVESFIRAQAARPVEAPGPQPAAAAPAGRPATAASPPAAPAESIRIPITGLRKVVAQRLATSRREIPEATIWLDVDATELFVARDRLLAATGERFSVTALIARFVVAGLRQYPLLNSSVDTASQEILQHGAINLGIAAQTSRGLMVPVVHGAHLMSTRQLRDAIAGLVAQAGDGLFAPSSLTGGTFTLNNFGALGVDGSAAIINHPEAAILGIGRMIERPWVVNHELAVRTVVELSMVFDHRVCDGGIAAGFLTYVARCIENPIALLADL